MKFEYSLSFYFIPSCEVAFMPIDHELLAELGIIVPEILLPADDIDPSRWAVIACDQHTSDREYWKRVDKNCAGSPNTLHLVFPEVYLEDDDADHRIGKIHRTMAEYLDKGYLKSRGRGWVYVQRETAASGMRQGIVLAVDLEHYDFTPGSTSLIRATEGTILERLPPRIEIRKDAILELPHIMILIDDREGAVIEPLEQHCDALEKVYDVELMEDGGHLTGYWIDDEERINSMARNLAAIADPGTARARYGSEKPLLFAMGDGNHSLATAKSVWESIKREHLEAGNGMDELDGHPARYALAEIVNIYSPGLRFEPIHRAIFGSSLPAFSAALRSVFPGAVLEDLGSEIAARDFLSGNSNGAVVYCGGTWQGLQAHPDELAPAVIDRAFGALDDAHAKIDFIHGWDHTKNLAAGGDDRIAVFFNVIPREELFSYVINHGALPRKAFSMGDAQEKRYYFEARRVR
jgi:hypothetical protein